MMRLPRKMTSKTTSHFDPRHACQRFSNIQKVSESATPAMRMSKCPAQNDVSDLKMSRNATPATQNGHRSKNEHQTALVKRDLWQRPKRIPHFAAPDGS
jgi:hypothetical protein